MRVSSLPYGVALRGVVILSISNVGAISVQLQMLNPESIMYFDRAFIISASALGPYAVWEFNHLVQVRDCSKLYELVDVVEYLKTTNSTVLVKCHQVKRNRIRTVWLPTVDGIFITQKPEQIFRSSLAPAMDAMFSITTQVDDIQFELKY